jgi:hypothetical protein
MGLLPLRHLRLRLTSERQAGAGMVARVWRERGAGGGYDVGVGSGGACVVRLLPHRWWRCGGAGWVWSHGGSP